MLYTAIIQKVRRYIQLFTECSPRLTVIYIYKYISKIANLLINKVSEYALRETQRGLCVNIRDYLFFFPSVTVFLRLYLYPRVINLGFVKNVFFIIYPQCIGNKNINYDCFRIQFQKLMIQNIQYLKCNFIPITSFNIVQYWGIMMRPHRLYLRKKLHVL